MTIKIEEGKYYQTKDDCIDDQRSDLIADPDAYDVWFRAKVQEALDDPCSAIPHTQVIQEVQARIDKREVTK